MNGIGRGPEGKLYHVQVSLSRTRNGMAMRPANEYHEKMTDTKDACIVSIVERGYMERLVGTGEAVFTSF